ncbi:MAG: iron-containing alcohol dehydrogenase [Thermoproteota archaeon]|nr:iron-containing alcohol dehydrogenase [Candidatus Brockarchaeota archaeon]MBO3767707.1 iron-containing alcohol dehydrogenase [Candidatus Brockarchaeota archaeon]MBO3801175.1 iron-containing alcohol dehydrogenase [Candidatus Brockarchaeota archaeon]
MDKEIQLSFSYPTNVIFKRGATKELSEILKQHDFGKSCLLVTGSNFARKTGYLDLLKNELRKINCETYVYDNVEPNPSIETVESGAMLASKMNVNFILAFGGGSVIDAAKAITLVYSSGKRIQNFLGDMSVSINTIPLVALPTTAGTGSEVSKYSVLTDVKQKKKLAIGGPALFPKLSILDPDTLITLPPNFVASTGIDALSHALESFFSKNSTVFSDVLSKESTRIILNNLPRAFGGDSEAKMWMMYASMLAGLSINITSTNVIHALGYYLTMHYGIPHGLANAMFLVNALEYEESFLTERFAELSEALGHSSPDNVVKSRLLLKDISLLLDALRIPRNLKEIGVKEDEIYSLVEEVTQNYSRNLLNSPIDLNREKLIEICKNAYVGRF